MTRIGLQLYSVRQDVDRDFAGTLEKVKACGFDCVEFAGYGGLKAERIKTLLDRVGLVGYAAHVGWQRLDQELDRVAEEAQILGMSYVFCPGYPIHDAGDCKAISDLLVRVERRLQPLGIQVGYHNHDREFVRFKGRFAMELIIENEADVPIHAELDLCWVRYSENDPVEVIDLFGAKAGPLHFKDLNADYKTRDRGAIDANVGEGIVDFPGAIAVARRNGILDKGIIIEQEAFVGDPYACLKTGVDNVRQMLG